MTLPISTDAESDFYRRIDGMGLREAEEAIAHELERTKDADLAYFLKGLRFFTQHGSIPGSFETRQIARLRLYAKALVANRVLNPSVLTQFQTSK